MQHFSWRSRYGLALVLSEASSTPGAAQNPQGRHKRLGAESPVRRLPLSLMKFISTFLRSPLAAAPDGASAAAAADAGPAGSS